MTAHRHPSRRSRQLAPTQPEMKAQPLAETALSPAPKKPSTMPSPGQARKSHRGRYAVHAQPLDVQAAVQDLTSRSPEERIRASKALRAYVSDTEKAREIVGILPPDSNRLIASVRAHCIELIRKEIR